MTKPIPYNFDNQLSKELQLGQNEEIYDRPNTMIIISKNSA